ncbi:MAG: hypothetical protein JRI80_00110 [Deltaproteobacteria bacterium]|nr:hypothetical protein [Deltaproteobacteria bacterium]
MTTALYAIWDAMRACLQKDAVLNEPGYGSLKVYMSVPDPPTDQHCTEVWIEHLSSPPVDATHVQHNFKIVVGYKSLAQPHDFGGDGKHPLERLCDIQIAIRDAIQDNTLGATVSGGCVVSSQSGIGVAEDPRYYTADSMIRCLELLNPDVNGPEITRQWRLYYGTRAYSTGAYTDVTDWKLLSKDVAFKHLPTLPGRSKLQTGFRNETRWPERESYTAEERHILTRVTKSDNETWGMYLGQTIAENADMPLMHHGTGFIGIPKKALLLVNLLSDGTYLVFYAPKVNIVPMADIGTTAPYMTLRGNMLGDAENLEPTDPNIIGHGKRYTSLSVDWD